MKSILGIGNALTDILAVLPDDSLLREFHLPVGSMQHVDKETGNKIWQVLKTIGAQYVAGGAAGNTITGTAVFGMPSGFIGKVGNDEIGALYRSDQERNGIKSNLLIGKEDSGRASVFITPPNAERTFATYLGAALELCPEDLRPEYFQGYDYFFIEGYLVQNQQLLRQAVKLAKDAGCYIAIDMASYNVVESNDIIAGMCDIAVVKIGAKGSYIKSGEEFHHVEACPADVRDATGAGDLYAAGFLYAHALGMPLDVCGKVGSITAGKVVEVIGPKIDIPRWKAAKKDIRALIAENI